MSDYFTFTVIEKGIEKCLTAKLLPKGFSHTIQITIDDLQLYFELDEERNYRLVKMPWQQEKDILKIPSEVIQQILSLLDEIKS